MEECFPRSRNRRMQLWCISQASPRSRTGRVQSSRCPQRTRCTRPPPSGGPRSLRDTSLCPPRRRRIAGRAWWWLLSSRTCSGIALRRPPAPRRLASRWMMFLEIQNIILLFWGHIVTSPLNHSPERILACVSSAVVRKIAGRSILQNVNERKNLPTGFEHRLNTLLWSWDC